MFSYVTCLGWIAFRVAVADPGGSRTPPPRSPPFVPRCRLFNIGPKIGPPSAPLPFLLVDLIWTPPPFKNPGSAPEL